MRPTRAPKPAPQNCILNSHPKLAPQAHTRHRASGTAGLIAILDCHPHWSLMPNTFHRVGHGAHPVLVLHGWFGYAHAFEPIEPWLSVDSFSYVFMDHRGYGGMRQATGAYTIDEIADDVLALADALGYREFSLIGHSMGGMVGERIAARAPERVRGMVALAPVPCGGVSYDAPHAATA